MKRVTLSETPASTQPPQQLAAEYWLDDSCILDMDYFVKTLSSIKAKGVRPDLVGSIIAHYASKWVPELSETSPNFEDTTSPKTATTTWRQKKFFVETIVSVLPIENDTVPCNFLLKLLRVANKVGVDHPYVDELETRVSWRLDEASLVEIMMPSFSHTCATLLDVELVLRLLKRFVGLDEGVKGTCALIKVAKLVDSYLAEAALDINLSLEDFVELAGVLPPHARAIDDGLYRAVDTFLKVHPGVPKQERKLLCRLIDSRKLSPEASLHASQNERLPLRAVVQVLFSEQNKINQKLEWSGSLGGFRSPNQGGFELPSRCHSKREVTVQNMEIKRLQDDVVRLQNQITALQSQVEKLAEKKKGFFRWKKLLLISASTAVNDGVRSEGVGKREFEEVGFGRHTPLPSSHPKGKHVNGKSSHRWRKSMS
ncbi:hypothetical protein RND81_09G120500 [Saponaria officinalis]|uniref:NPH3 domain-containing protein n=1 Tax=Saponaria officinalis TaxID=3572 RepID=A0AAW1ILF8_SAPOF